ncbi:MAG: DUF177 domain-containing protein [Elusimicrobia bacterium]|nr:DUF177 domain-containing protein [Elusimicrobiota bacterium]
MNQKLVFATREIETKGGLTCAETLTAAELAERSEGGDAGFGEARLTTPCEIRLEFSIGGENMLMEGKIQGQWDMECSRCLAPHMVDFEGVLEETYPLTQDVIDVWEDVRQAMVLSVPDRALCSPTCLGLCPRCGKDLNQGACGCAPLPKEVRGPRVT